MSVRASGGLGLYIVRWIATAHGGTLRVESKPGAGATLGMELPSHPAKTEPEGQGALSRAA